MNPPDPTQYDALGFLDCVKSAYPDSRTTYTAFLHILADFKAERISVTELMYKFRDLYRDKPQLFRGFGQFLPEGYRIEADGTVVTPHD
ncbi:hypothetical protein GCG54_00011203 [Colletotrichum gloeosporioides]|uniref:Uncharacterized protein n=1 Tax=Colletotrichum gloeosporioides TaxID=474922 RepID=A0A8H4CS60_COLGL|nr:uncharacterized protein GCG54_00011203 [Colletotrichum gloeosporioides]KAF3809009.1 hypothetical protein GCG54_00011203 [Colletotrichum gloeosporioides]